MNSPTYTRVIDGKEITYPTYRKYDVLRTDGRRATLVAVGSGSVTLGDGFEDVSMDEVLPHEPEFISELVALESLNDLAVNALTPWDVESARAAIRWAEARTTGAIK